MNNLSIKYKVGILCGFLLVLLTGVGGIAYVGISNTEVKLHEVTDINLPALHNMTLAEMMNEGLRAVAYRALFVAEIQDVEGKKEVAIELKEMSENISKYMKTIEELQVAQETKKAINDVKPEIETYVKSTEEIVGLSLAGQREAAVSKLPQFQKTFEDLETKLGTLGELIEKDATESSKSGSETASRFHNLINIVVVVSLLLGLLVSVWIIRDLMKTLSSVIERLATSSREVGSASQQSSVTAKSLSEASLSQASSLQETMASAEEISAMVDQNAESATRAKQVVDQNAEVTEVGSKSVSDMLSAISEIKSTNDEILSQMESSNKEFSNIVKIISEIGNKTKVINDIVFQTKLLSFNASVEAARAGEHGKGFAVVAEEVGNLAQMSGNAAKVITDMLDDSVKKVNEIVESTTQKVDQLVEVGKDKISMGQATAQRCRDSLNKISDNAKTVAQMVTEITNASREQAQGVQEINKAIAQLDQITQQNTAVAQQSAAQSIQLNSESDNLATVVDDLLKFVGMKQSNSLLARVAPAYSKSVSHRQVPSLIERNTTPDKKVTPIGNRNELASKTGRHISKQERALKSVVFKKAVGSNDIPSGDDPHFEEF